MPRLRPLDPTKPLARGKLSAKLRERIALAVAELNRCEYCVSARSAVGRSIGLSGEEIQDAREGRAVAALDVFTSYFNRVAVAEVDFPEVPLLTAS